MCMIHESHVVITKYGSWETDQKYRKYLFCKKFDSKHVAKKAPMTRLLLLCIIDLVLIVSSTKIFFVMNM